MVTIGGGRILGVSNVRLRRKKAWTLNALAARRDALDEPERWCELMLREGSPLSAGELQNFGVVLKRLSGSRTPALLDPDTPPATLAAYYQELWTKLPLKWKAKADLNEVFAPQHPLGQWRNMARELYALELRLPAQRASHASSALTP